MRGSPAPAPAGSARSSIRPAGPAPRAATTPKAARLDRPLLAELPACLEQQFAQLAHGAAASGGAGHVMRTALHRLRSIRHRDREAAALHDRKVGEVIAHERA